MDAAQAQQVAATPDKGVINNLIVSFVDSETPLRTNVPFSVEKPRSPHQELTRIFDINTGLVGYAMKRWFPDITGTDEQEYKSAGYLGLWKACEKYDPSRGMKFSTYAISYIRGYLLHEQRDRKRAAKVPLLSLDAPMVVDGEVEADTALVHRVRASREHDPAAVLEGREKLIDACRVWLEGYHRARGLNRHRKADQYEAMRLGLAEIGTTPEQICGRPARHPQKQTSTFA